MQQARRPPACRGSGTYYLFQTGWQSQIAALTAAVNKMTELPTVALDLEGAEPNQS